MSFAYRAGLTATCSVLALILASQAAQAADAPPTTTTTVQEVVVTADKRPERLKDVPASVTAITAQQLTSTGAVKFEDYVARVPGLEISNTSAGGGLNQLSLRGVTTGQGGNPTVGFYIDDAPFGSSTNLGGGAVLAPDLDPSDLSRIEVLRGPQGTLYGAGSMGGLLNFVTTPPNPAAFSGRLEVDASTVDGGGSGWGIRGAANVPLGDQFAVRVSGFDRKDPGFVDDVTNGAKNVNSAHDDGGRIALGWRLDDHWNLTLSALTQEMKVDGAPTVDYDAFTGQPVYGDLKQARAPGTGEADARYSLYDLHLDGDLGWAKLVSVTSYGTLRANLNTDVSGLYGAFLGPILGVPNLGAAIQTDAALDKYSEEVRLSGPTDARLSWQVGAFYTHERVGYVQSVPSFDAVTGGPLTPPVGSLGSASVPSTFEEAAVFGDVDYHFTDRFDVLAGLRYSHNNQTAIETTGGILFGPTTTVNLTSSDSSTTWLITPRLKLNDDTMIYARIATGYRPGGPNIAAVSVSPSYAPDRTTDYEAGIKTALFDHTLSLDLAAFYIDWIDIQLRDQTPAGIEFFSNGGKAVSEGFEGAFDWRPLQGLSISGNVSYIDAYLRSNLPAPLIGHSGDALPATARWSGLVSADYRWPLMGEWNGIVGASWRYVGARPGDFASVAVIPRYRLPSYDTLDLRAGLDNGRWSLMAYVKNVNDARGQLSAFNLGAVQEVPVIQPRTFGLSISRSF
jgi:outer membrane receptor protein involved in Fe transport